MTGVLTANLVLQKTKLDNLRHVRKLNICNIGVHDLGVLRSTQLLEVLAASVNEIEDLEPLSHCTNLKELYLRQNRIRDIQQILFLSKLPYLSCLTLMDNAVSQDPNYRSFCIAAIPTLVKFDNDDVSPAERKESERMFPDLGYMSPPSSKLNQSASPPSGMYGSPSKAGSPGGYETPRRHYEAYASPANEVSLPLSDVPLASAGMVPRASQSLNSARGASSVVDNQHLSRRFEELTSGFDERPVGSAGARRSSAAPTSSSVGPGASRGTVVRRSANESSLQLRRPASSSALPLAGPGGVQLSPRQGSSSQRTSPSPASAPRDEGIVMAIKVLLGELGPGGLNEIRRHVDQLMR